MKWTFENIPNLTGKVVIVTGGNSGIGYEVSRMSISRGATVIVASRNTERGTKAVEKLQSQSLDGQIEFIQLDLASLKSIRQFVNEFRNRYNELHFLINNAGIMAVPYSTTQDGFERQFGTNHLGHFALTGLLLESLQNTPNSRVITVSSNAHRKGTIDFNDLQMKQKYSRVKSYSRSKLANLLFAYELQRKFDENNIDTLSLAAHPGISHTNLAFQDRGMVQFLPFKLVGRLISRILLQSAEMGALPLAYAAYADDVEGGSYYGPDGHKQRRGYPTKVESISISHDKDIAKKLWEVSEDLTGVKYEF